MRVTNHRLLRFFGFTPTSSMAKCEVDFPLTDWLRFAWWRITGRVCAGRKLP